MARREPVRLPRVRLATARPPRAGLPAAGWEQPRPVADGGGGTDPGAMEAAIMEALVLWYDPRRQGATNESMAADPHLKDLSGGGHDAKCQNFAWGGMSGIGGYTDNIFTSGRYVIFHSEYLIAPDTISFYNTYTGSPLGIGYWETASMTPRLLLEVSGIKAGEHLYVTQYNQKNDHTADVELHNGYNDVQLTFSDQYSQYATLFASYKPIDNPITVRILPLYPGALVSDGVDDLCWVEQLEVLTDFTVMAERQFGRFNNAGLAARQGVFSFEQNNSGQPSATVPQTALSFGATTFVPSREVPAGRAVSWMTPTSYNGMGITRGGGADDGTAALWLFKRDASANHLSAALWSFLLFRRTLTGAEIEWVKAHMMGEP